MVQGQVKGHNAVTACGIGQMGGVISRLRVSHAVICERPTGDERGVVCRGMAHCQMDGDYAVATVAVDESFRERAVLPVHFAIPYERVAGAGIQYHRIRFVGMQGKDHDAVAAERGGVRDGLGVGVRERQSVPINRHVIGADHRVKVSHREGQDRNIRHHRAVAARRILKSLIVNPTSYISRAVPFKGFANRGVEAGETAGGDVHGHHQHAVATVHVPQGRVRRPACVENATVPSQGELALADRGVQVGGVSLVNGQVHPAQIAAALPVGEPSFVYS